MGICASANHAEASVVVSAGENTTHACFMVCLKVDLYQPKYANIPMSFSVTPCQEGQGFVDGYGVGTCFSARNAIGAQEIHKLVVVDPLARIVTEQSGGYQCTFTTTALPNGDCKMGIAFDGRGMGGFQNHVAMQLDTMKAFIIQNVAAICNDAPPLPSVPLASVAAPLVDKIPTPTAPPAAPTAPPAAPTAFCGGCGKANGSTSFCTGCGASSGDDPTGGAPASAVFVEVPEHAQAQQAQQAMFQLSQTSAIMQQAQHLSSNVRQ